MMHWGEASLNMPLTRFLALDDLDKLLLLLMANPKQYEAHNDLGDGRLKKMKRRLVATAALFLAAKSEETSCLLNTVLRTSCEVSQNQEFNILPYMMCGQDWFEQYRERVIHVEQMILTTLDFELEVTHPYASLSSSLSKLGLSQTVLFNMAWNLINEGLRSSLWLQFKPHHIAAGAAFLAAKFLRYDISLNPRFWHEFKTAPNIVQDVVQQLKEIL